ncbi:MAG: thioredoxin family protein [Spirochaetales bacterium]|nr:thioredoxin family protein [Spirochaetales bacterium]
MIEIKSKEELDKAVKDTPFGLFYVTRPMCGVGTDVKQKVIEMAADYPKLETFYINLENDETIAGQYSIFTIPAILVYAGGKEYIREARFLSMDELETKISRISDLI